MPPAPYNSVCCHVAKTAEKSTDFVMTADSYEVDQNGSHEAQQQPTNDSGTYRSQYNYTTYLVSEAFFQKCTKMYVVKTVLKTSRTKCRDSICKQDCMGI